MEKNFDTYIEDEAKRYIVRWECIRNHPIYIKDYARYRKEFQNAGKNKKEIEGKWREHFSDWFNLWEPLNPQKTFVSLIPKNTKQHINKRTCDKILLQFRNWSKAAYYVRSDGKLSLKDVEPLTKKALRDKTLLDIAIKIEKPKTKIMLEVENIVEKWIKLKRKVIPKVDKRKRIEGDVKCFQIYNLRKTKRMSWEELARIYPDAGGVEYAKVKIKRQYKRAQKLIWEMHLDR